MKKADLKQLILNKGVNQEIINSLTLKQLNTLDGLLFEQEPSKYIDELLELVVARIEELNSKANKNLKSVASEKNSKKAPKAPKAQKEVKEVKKEEGKKEAPKAPKEDKKSNKKEAPVDNSKKAPVEDKKALTVDFSKYTGYDLEMIFRSPYNALNKEDKKVHTALNKEYEKLKKGDRVFMTVEGDIEGVYGVIPTTIVYRDAVSAIAVDIETFSKYEINRISWAKKEIVRNRVLANGTIETMIFLIQDNNK